MLIHRYCTALTILAALLVGTVSTAVAGNYFLYVEGQTQGHIPGDVTTQDYEDWIEATSFSHSVSVELDIHGNPGRVTVSPLQLTKRQDISSVLLHHAAFNGERLPEVTLELTGQDPQDPTRPGYRIRLDDAIISTISTAGEAPNLPTETIAFTYQTITLTDLIEGTETSYPMTTQATVQTDFPGGVILLPPSPNPMAATTEFRFALPKASDAVLAIYDVRGRRVRELYNGWVPAETKSATWDGLDASGRRVAQGMYIARLEYPGMMVTQRISVVR